MEKFIMAAGTAIRVSDTQEGPSTVVLLHGYLENLSVWDDLTELIRPHLRVIALDLPGHGISEVKGPVHTMDFLADVVHEALLQLGVVKCCLIGHSMGGYVALAMAERHTEIMSGMILISSTPNADSPEKLENRLREIAIVEGGKKELLGRTLPVKGFAPQNILRLEDLIEDYAEMIYLTEDEGITSLLRGMMERPDRNRIMSELDIPKLMIFGCHDAYIPVAAAKEVAVNQPGTRVIWLENSGHNGFLEEPELTAKIILQFIGDNNL